MSIKPRISIVLPNLSGGGAERLHVYLANDWVERGHSVEFVLMRGCGELLPLLSPKVTIVELGVDRGRQVISPLRHYLKQSRPDIVLSAMWPLTSISAVAWMLSGRHGRLFLSDHSHLSTSCVRGLKTPLVALKTLIRITYPFASGIIGVSQGVKDDLCRLGGLAEARVEVIYNPTATGVSPHRESQEVRDQLWGVGFDHHILSVGTLKEQKDHRTLIRAFARLSRDCNAKLTILGEGQLRASLEKLIAELGMQSRVSMPGFVVDPYPWFRSADLFVLSSLYEGFGNVIVEALECGVPVVSTDCPSGPAEILGNGRYGRLVPVDDAAALVTAIAASLSESHDREKLMERAKAFSVRSISDQYLNYFFSIKE
jgi:glycosyltransferase involved in cell wall biosynthesis